MKELLSLQDHARRLFMCLYELDKPYKFQSSYSWLDVASRIEQVKYNGYLYDYSMGFCRDDYSDAIHQLNNKLLPELVFFNFAYCGLESLITTLEIHDSRKPGKILSATKYISKHFEPLNIRLKYYEECILHLKSLLSKKNILTKEKYTSEKVFATTENTSFHGVGLSVIYKIRNDFAHGSFLFPEPEDFSFEKPFEIDIYATASRVVLLSYQILLMAFYKTCNFKSRAECFGMVHEIYLPTMDYLRVLHYYNFTENDENESEQLDLEFN